MRVKDERCTQCSEKTPTRPGVQRNSESFFYTFSGEVKMQDFVWNWVTTGFVVWTTIFLVVRMALPHRSFDFCTRLVSTMHACAAVCLAVFSVQDWSCPVCPLGSRSSPLQMKCLTVSLSYLIYDSVCSLFDKMINVSNLVHHTIAIVGLLAGLGYEMCGSEMVATMWVTEVSTPFLHTREFLKELGYKDTDLNLVVDILFAAIFSFARMICGPYLVTVTWMADYPFLIKAMALGLQLVSAFWFFKIARMVRYKLVRRSTTAKLA